VRVDFYTVGERFLGRPLVLVGKLCEKARIAGFEVQILCADANQLRALDHALWELDGNAFLPHAVESDDDARYAPIRLCLGREALDSDARYVINLTVAPEPLPSGAYRLAEVVFSDELSKLNGRARFRCYRAAGLDPQHHVL